MKSKFLTALFILLYVLLFNHIVFNLKGDMYISAVFRALIFPCFFIIYITSGKTLDTYFTSFLLLFSMVELAAILYFFIGDSGLLLIIGSIVYVISYVCLLLHILKSLTLKQLLSKYKIHLFVLIAVSAYFTWSIDDFLLTVNKDPTISIPKLDLLRRIVEGLYNFSTLSVLSLAFISYLNSESRRNTLLLAACGFIVFSEIIQISIVNQVMYQSLYKTYTLLMMLGFFFLYKYVIRHYD